MSLRRAVGFLLTQRFSPRVIPRTAPARSFHTLKELPIGRGAAGVGLAAAAFAGAGAWAVQHFRKGPDDIESAARKEEQDTKASFESWMKEEDMTARFENWIKEYNKTYRDEEEKAMRFQAFKDTIKSIESLPPSTQKKFLPPNGFADLTSEELPCIQPCIDDDLDDADSEEYRQNKFLAENENGEAIVW